MNLFQIIEDKIQWEILLDYFEEADIYYSFEYGTLFTNKENGQLLAAYFEYESSKVFYPFIKRKVEWQGEVVFDLVTPYGYGGPLIKGDSLTSVYFYECFANYCKENNIITETIRFHPLMKNYEWCREVVNVEYIRKTTAVDLTLSLEEIRKQYSSMNKRNINKAKNIGIVCQLAENNTNNVEIFIELYKETMDRNQADSYYYFTDKYFMEQIKNTKISETSLIFAHYGDEVIAGVMVLTGPNYSHYHLGASKTKYLHLRPNNLLFDFMIEFCKTKGSKLLHLGGGYQENDGLFKFKASFTNNNHYDYFMGKRVYDEIKYNKINENIQCRYEVDDKYFPIYRGKKGMLINT